MKFKKILLALSISMLTACGGGSGGTDSGGNTGGGEGGNTGGSTGGNTGGGTGGNTGGGTTTVVETAVSGKAIKGTMSNGVIKVFKYVDNAPVELTSEELKDTSVSTDASGNYTFTVLDYTGPIKIEVGVSADPTSPTFMLCDAPSGCGTVAFGDEVNLTTTAPDFALSSVSSVDSGTPAKLNVSPLTHIATSMLEASQEDVSLESIQQNFSKVANTFGVQGNLSELEPTSMNNGAEVAAEDNEAELRYGLINAGIAESLFSNGDLTASFNSATADIVANNGDLLVVPDGEGDFEFSMTEILDAAANTASMVAANIAADSSIENSSVIIDTLNQTQNTLENESENKELLVDENGRTNSESEEVTTGEAVDKAKAMVGDVRVFANLFDKDHASNAGIRAQGEDLIALIEDANTMVELEGDNFTLLSTISELVTDLSMRDLGNQTTFNLAEELGAQSGVTGTLVMDEDNYTFVVDASKADSEALALNLVLALNEAGDQIQLSLMGIMETAGASFGIKDTSKVFLNLETAVTQEELESGDADTDIIGGGFELSIAIEQKASSTITNPISFEGKLAAELVMVDVPSLRSEYFDEPNYVDVQEFYIPTTEQQAVPKSVVFSGAFASAEGESFTATLALDVNELDTFAPDGIKNGVGALLEEPGIYVSVSDDENTVTWTGNDTYFLTPRSKTRTYENLSDSDLTHNRVTGYYTEGDWIREDITEYSHVQTETEQGLILNEHRYLAAYAGSASNDYISIFYQIAKELDTDNDGAVDRHQTVTKRLSLNQPLGVDFEVANLIDENDNILVYQGNVSESTDSVTGEFLDSFESYVDNNIANRNKDINSALDAFNLAFGITPDQPVYDMWETNVGIILSDESDLRSLEGGLDNFGVRAYIVQPILKDAMTLDVSSDNSEFVISVEGGQELTVSTTEDSETGTFTYDSTFDSDSYSKNISLFSVKSDTDGEERYGYYLTEKEVYSDGYEWNAATRYEVYSEDTDQNGEIDEFEWYVTIYWGQSFNENYELVDYDGTIVTNGYVSSLFAINMQFKSDYGVSFYNFLGESNAASSVLMRLHENRYISNNNYLNPFKFSQIDGVGYISRFELMSEEVGSNVFEPGNTTSYDVYVVEPDSTEILESEDNYLDLAASLSVGLVLQDYEVNLMLSGERTEFEDGKFALDLSYKTPDSELQRTFNVKVESMFSDSFLMTNAEGVILRMTGNEDEGTEGEDVVIGTITVGANATLAAEIIVRDSTILIRYNDENGTIESL